MMDWQAFDRWCAALCAWREARSEGREGIRAVIHVINNRSKKWAKPWSKVVFQPLQFSSMTYPKDPQLSFVPGQPDSGFVDCWEIAEAVQSGSDADLTLGATHYFADYIAVPEWAKTMTQTAKIGRHTFFK